MKTFLAIIPVSEGRVAIFKNKKGFWGVPYKPLGDQAIDLELKEQKYSKALIEGLGLKTFGTVSINGFTAATSTKFILAHEIIVEAIFPTYDLLSAGHYDNYDKAFFIRPLMEDIIRPYAERLKVSSQNLS